MFLILINWKAKKKFYTQQCLNIGNEAAEQAEVVGSTTTVGPLS